ncbi:DUF4325 domain-containing protein [Cycloclasticus sp.]|uniref:DUF4325 domain-containing protein n=1 Tax=Cycloclasticus sp. TaxID=2024830 RepID=UPI000C113941|nr:DUF4325 domain-containing protein [Cycloclasticus sp.]PHR52029.1 MAG: DUF4325 domain-containing protein [Cycloclasticus sp.]
MNILNIGQDFSKDPAGRFRADGEGNNGEEFREDHLKPRIDSLAEDEKLIIIIDDGIEGYGSSFLVEGFAGLVKFGYITAEDLLGKIEIRYENEEFEFYENKIIEYIKQAKFNSKHYSSGS